MTTLDELANKYLEAVRKQNKAAEKKNVMAFLRYSRQAAVYKRRMQKEYPADRLLDDPDIEAFIEKLVAQPPAAPAREGQQGQG